MKKLLCTLLAVLMLIGGMALAESEAPAEEPAAEAAPIEEAPAEEAPAEEIPVEEEVLAEEDIPDAPSTVRMGFEDGFALELPNGWLYHPVSEAMAEHGVVYCLSDAEEAGWLYVQSWASECADINALKELVDRTADVQTSGVYAFNGTDFVVYDMTEGDVSCCAALLNGRVLNLVFSPQSDADFMAVAAQILATFEIL